MIVDNLGHRGVMRISFGATRAVILMGPWAVKIARFRPIWAIGRLLSYLRARSVRNRLRHYGDSAFTGGIKYLLAGILANRAEARLWSEARSDFLAPTLCSFFGLVNIQVRGESVSEAELALDNPMRPFLSGVSEDIELEHTQAKQFCRIDGKICLADYGWPGTCSLIRKHRSRSFTLLAAQP